MSKRIANPRRLDVEAFAEAADDLDGEWPLSALSRLSATAEARAADDAEQAVRWRVRGERRKTGAGQALIWLHLDASAEVTLLCQRCLHPVSIAVDVERSFIFVHGEQAAAELDEDSGDDVLALTRSLDLRDFVEDELLLALPLVPKHEHCPQPLVANVEQAAPDAGAPHPFAGLASLKPRGRGRG